MVKAVAKGKKVKAPLGLTERPNEPKEKANLHTKKKPVQGVDMTATGSGLASLINKGLVTPGDQGTATKKDLSLASSVDKNTKPDANQGLVTPEKRPGLASPARQNKPSGKALAGITNLELLRAEMKQVVGDLTSPHTSVDEKNRAVGNHPHTQCSIESITFQGPAQSTEASPLPGGLIVETVSYSKALKETAPPLEAVPSQHSRKRLTRHLTLFKVGQYETVETIVAQISKAFQLAPAELFEAVSKDTRYKQFGRFYVLFKTNAHFQRAHDDGFFIGRNFISGRRGTNATTKLTETGVSGDATKPPFRPVRTGYIPNIPPWICQDDVRLLLAPYGEVIDLAINKSRDLGILTGGVRFAIRLEVDQSMPDMVRVLGVNYAVLYPGKQRKAAISKQTSNSAPEESSVGNHPVTGVEASHVASEVVSSTKPIQSGSHPIIQTTNSTTVHNVQTTPKPTKSTHLEESPDGNLDDMHSDKSSIHTNSAPETDPDSEAEDVIFELHTEAEGKMDTSSEAVAQTTVESSPINRPKIPLSTSIPDVRQVASTIAPASGIEHPPSITKATLLSNQKPSISRTFRQRLSPGCRNESTHIAIKTYNATVVRIAKEMPGRDFKRLFESIIQRDLRKYHQFRSAWKPPRGLEDAFKPWKSVLEDLLVNRTSLLQQIEQDENVERRIQGKETLEYSSVYYDDPGRDYSVEEKEDIINNKQSQEINKAAGEKS